MINTNYSVCNPDTKKVYDVRIYKGTYIRFTLSYNNILITEGVVDLIKTNDENCHKCKYFVMCEKIKNVMLEQGASKLVHNIIKEINNMKEYKCESEEK